MQINKYTLLVISFFLVSVLGDIIVTFIDSLERINIILKGGFIVLFLLLVLLKKKHNIPFLLLFLTPFLLFSVGSLFNRILLNGSYEIIHYVETSIWILKNLTVFIFYFFFREFITNEKELEKVNKVAVLMITIYLLTLFGGFLFSIDVFRTYEGGFRAGYKGIIVAQNEGSIFLVFALFFLRSVKPFKWKGILLLFNFLALALIGTKAGLLATILVLWVIFSERHGFKKSVFFTGFVAIAILLLLFILYHSFPILKDYIDLAWQYFQYRIDKGIDLWTLLLSGRNEKLIRVIQELWQHSLIALFMGGHPISFYFVELDLFDIMAAVGIIGGLIYFIILRKVFKSANAIFHFIVFFAIAMTAGHATYSVLAAPYIALFLVNNQKNKN